MGTDEEKLARQKAFVIQCAYWAVWIIPAVLLIRMVGQTLSPFVAAFVVACLLLRPVDLLAKVTHLPRRMVAVIVVLGFYGVVALAVCLFGKLLFDSKMTELLPFLYEEISSALEQGGSHIRRLLGAEDDAWQIRQLFGELSSAIVPLLSAFVAKLPGIFVKALLAVIATILMELEIHRILLFLLRQMPARWQEGVRRGKDEAWAVCVRILFSYVIIFAMTYAELAIGLSLLQIPGALVIALVIAALDILPVLGTGTVLIPWFLLAFAVGRLSVGIGILILYLVITIVRNLAEPKLVGGQMGLSPVVMLPCMLAGYELFGFAGLFGVPLLVSVLRKLNDRGIIRIFR